MVGVMFVFVNNSIGGPGMFKVMSATQTHLKEQYGKTQQWNISVQDHVDTSTNPPAGYYIIEYSFGGKTGKLKAQHEDYQNNKTFEFEEMD